MHRKLHLPKTAFGHPCHADLFERPGAAEPSGASQVIYVGGACSEAEYEARAESPAWMIAEPWEAALERQQVSAARLLVIPCPPGDPERLSSRLADFRDLVLKGFAGLAGLDLEAPLALAGTSVGAHLVIGLLAGTCRTGRLVTFGGVGMIEAAQEGQTRPASVLCFVNQPDWELAPAERFRSWLQPHGVPCEVRLGEGGHSMADYAANGTLAGGFEFLTCRADNEPRDTPRSG